MKKRTKKLKKQRPVQSAETPEAIELTISILKRAEQLEKEGTG